MKRKELVAAYIRVSSQEQKLHGLSLDAQKMKLQEYAEQHDMQIVEWYMDEGVSGRKPIKKRPELQRMIRDAEAKKFDRIIFIKLDRFFRSVAEYHECMKRIEPIIWTATEEKYDLSTANGRVYVNMKLTIAEFEADQTGDRIRLVNDYKVKEGLPVTGTMSFAFKIVVGSNGRKQIIRNPETEAMAFEMIDYFERFQNVSKTSQYISEKYNYNMNVDKVKHFLQSPRICGEYRGNPNYNQPYITRERFDRIQEIFKRNIKETTTSNDYIFSRLIICPECGSSLCGMPSRQKKKNSDGHYIYKKYRCKNHYMKKTCGFLKNISENILERQMLEQIAGELDRVKAESLAAGIKDAPKNNIKQIESEIDRLNYAWQKGRIKNVEEYDREYDALMEKLESMKKKATAAVDTSRIEAMLSAGWKELYAELDTLHKQAFWHSFVESIEVEWTDDMKRIAKVNFF